MYACTNRNKENTEKKNQEFKEEWSICCQQLASSCACTNQNKMYKAFSQLQQKAAPVKDQTISKLNAGICISNQAVSISSS